MQNLGLKMMMMKIIIVRHDFKKGAFREESVRGERRW
jgi:hypothetical protein